MKNQISSFHSALPTREPLFKVPKITCLVTSIISSLLIAKLKLIWRGADMKILRRVWCGKIGGSEIRMRLTTGKGGGVASKCFQWNDCSGSHSFLLQMHVSCIFNCNNLLCIYFLILWFQIRILYIHNFIQFIFPENFVSGLFSARLVAPLVRTDCICIADARLWISASLTFFLPLSSQLL